MNTHTITLQWPYFACISCKREAPASSASFSDDGECRGSSPPGVPWQSAMVGGPLQYLVAICPECLAKMPESHGARRGY